MTSAFTRGERAWSDAATTSHPTNDASSSSFLFSSRQPQRLSRDFSVAASPSSPSLDEIRARLHDVMRSIDDTLVEAEAAPSMVQPFSRTAITTGAAAANSAFVPSTPCFVGGRVSWADGTLGRVDHRPPVRPTAPPASSSSTSSSCSALPLSSAAAAASDGEVDSAATGATAGTGLSATYKAMLDYWHAGAASSLLPPPSTVPSLSARLAVLRAAEAQQRQVLQRRADGASTTFPEPAEAGETEESLGLHDTRFARRDRRSPLRYTEESRPAMRGFRDPHSAAAAAAFSSPPPVEGAAPLPNSPAPHTCDTAVADTPVAHRRPPPSPQTSRPINPQSYQFYESKNNNNNPSKHGDVFYSGLPSTGASGINVSHSSEVLVHSPNTSRENSPGSVERRVRREARLEETSHIVTLALERQAAAEAAWRAGQSQLRTPPAQPGGKSSASEAWMGHPTASVSEHYTSRQERADGGRGAGDGWTITTAPLDALQARLTLSTSAAALVTAANAVDGREGNGELPMREELAVRARLAARRNSRENATSLAGVSDSPPKLLPDSYARLSEARDRDVSQHLQEEVAHQTKVQVDARARVARARVNVPASETCISQRSAELQAIRAHAQQLEKLRRQMQRETAATAPPLTPVQPSANTGRATQQAAVGAMSGGGGDGGGMCAEAASTASSSTLNIPEVSPSPPRAPSREVVRLPAPPQTAASSCKPFLSHSTRSPAVEQGVTPADSTNMHDRNISSRMTALSTAAALKASSVEVDATDDNDDGVDGRDAAASTSVSATSLDDARAPTPEQWVSPKPRRVASSHKLSDTALSSPAHLQNGQGPLPHEGASRRRGAREPAAAAGGAVAASADVSSSQWKKRGVLVDGDGDSGSDATQAEATSQRDWASSTQLPPPPARPARPPPSPEPKKPHTTVGTQTRSDVGVTQHHHHCHIKNRDALSKPAEGLMAAPLTPRRASQPVVDAERDIISSSPSAVRPSHPGDHDDNSSVLTANGDFESRSGVGSLTPERLAAIQSTRLHVSPTRGTAWQNGCASAFSPQPVSSSSLASSSCPSSSSLNDLLALSPFAATLSSRHKRRSTTALRNSQTQTLPSVSAPSSDSPTRGPSLHDAPRSAAPSPRTSPLYAGGDGGRGGGAAAAAAPLLVHERAVQRAVSRRTALRAQTMLCEHGVSVEVQLAGRRLPAVVKLSKDKRELLFYLERVTEAPAAVSPPGAPRARSLVTPPPPSSTASVVSELPSRSPRAFPLHPQQHPQPQHPTPADPNQRGFLYSVAPSVQLREAGSRGKVQPAEAWVRRKVMASPPPPSGGAQTSEVHLVPASQAAPPHPSPARFRAPPSPTLHPMLVQQAQPAAPVSSRVAAPSIVGARRASRSRLPASLSRSSSVSPPRVMHVRELHHFPCSYARVYVPYGVMGYEEDCGFGGPGTWEDVQGILCGPAAYEVLRRYGCPLFASMRGRDYVPYRVYVIIPEFRRVDIPQDAVLLVLDFKQRVDWVLFLLAMQLYLAKDDGDVDDEKRCDGPTSTRTTGNTEAAPTASRHARHPVLSYGRALWMLAVQRLQRARALRGLNPFESHVSARQFERPTDESPSRQRRESLLRGEVDTEDESRKNRAEEQAARPRRVPAASAVSATSALSSRTSSPPQYGVQGAPTSRLASPGTGVSAAAAARPLQFVAPSSLCPPPATAPPNAVLRSPRRGRVMDPRLAQRRQQQQQQPLRRSLQPQQLLEHFQSPPRVPSPAATAAAPRILSNKNNSEGGHNFNYVQMTNGNVQHVTSAVRVGPSQGRRRGPPAASTAAPNQAMQAPQHAAPAPVSSAEERTSPLSAEATSKPRFRWLKRVANTLNSGRRGSASGKHTPAATAEMRSNGVQ